MTDETSETIEAIDDPTSKNAAEFRTAREQRDGDRDDRHSTLVSARCVECRVVRTKKTYTDTDETRSFRHVCHDCQTATWWNVLRVLEDDQDDDDPELVTDGGLPDGEVEQTDPVTALTDAIDKHIDEDDRPGTSVGPVIEDMLSDTTIDIGDVGHALKEAYFHGVVYQPDESRVARVATDGGVSHRAECPECSWSGDAETLSGAAREADQHRQETGHDAKIERVTDGGRSE
jgi:hypothetical protein